MLTWRKKLIYKPSTTCESRFMIFWPRSLKCQQTCSASMPTIMSNGIGSWMLKTTSSAIPRWCKCVKRSKSARGSVTNYKSIPYGILAGPVSAPVVIASALRIVEWAKSSALAYLSTSNSWKTWCSSICSSRSSVSPLTSSSGTATIWMSAVLKASTSTKA